MEVGRDTPRSHDSAVEAKLKIPESSFSSCIEYFLSIVGGDGSSVLREVVMGYDTLMRGVLLKTNETIVLVVVVVIYTVVDMKAR